MSPETAALFVAATDTSMQAKLTYAKCLAGTMKQLGFTVTPLHTVAAALRAQGAAIPMHQAEPIEKSTLMSWAKRQDIRTYIATCIAWKTASRWAEVRDLTRRHFIKLTPSEVIIDWFRLPKGRNVDPFTPSRFAVIRGDLTDIIASTIPTLLSDDATKLTDMLASEIDAIWANHDTMKRYGAHSIKAGALSYLTERAAERKLDPLLISVLGKHQHTNVLAKMTNRYVHRKSSLALAELYRTGEATILL